MKITIRQTDPGVEMQCAWTKQMFTTERTGYFTEDGSQISKEASGHPRAEIELDKDLTLPAEIDNPVKLGDYLFKTLGLQRGTDTYLKAYGRYRDMMPPLQSFNRNK